MLREPDTHKLSKADSARINGAKSSGPTTASGKSRSAKGNLKHGAYSSRVLMEDEDPVAYQNLKTDYLEYFLPRDPFEAECVVSMVTARWRIRRLESSETANLDIAHAVNKEDNASRFHPLDRRHERAIAVHSQIDAIEKATRVEERLNRIYDRHYRLLAKHRGSPLPGVSDPINAVEDTPAADLTNHPNSASNPLPATPSASLAANLAILILILAIYLITPTLATAQERAAQLAPPAFYAATGHLARPPGRCGVSGSQQ